MRSHPSGKFARQVALGRGALRVLSRALPEASSQRPRKGQPGRLPMSTAIPLWGILSIVGWLVTAHLTVNLMGPAERQQIANSSGAAADSTEIANFMTAAGEPDR